MARTNTNALKQALILFQMASILRDNSFSKEARECVDRGMALVRTSD